jgi:hypothetical protein
MEREGENVTDRLGLEPENPIRVGGDAAFSWPKTENVLRAVVEPVKRSKMEPSLDKGERINSQKLD